MRSFQLPRVISWQWLVGAVLLFAFNLGSLLVRFPLGRKSRWIAYPTVLVVLWFSWIVPDGDRRFDTPAAAASLDHGYGLVAWEFENFLDKWTHRVWTALPWTPTSTADRQAHIDRYVDLVGELRTARDMLNSLASDPSATDREVRDAQRAVDELISERDRIRPAIEEYLEQKISEMIRSDEVNLTGNWVWPPVDFRIGDPPKLLVTSPRDWILRLEDVLIDPDVTIAEMEKIEGRLAIDLDTSAVVLQTGGLASYPNVIPTTHLKRLLDVGSHEWLHSYLAFYPLGQAYFGDGQMRSVNETLADIFGREVGWRVYSELTGEDFVAPVRPERARRTEESNDGAPEAVPDPNEFSFNSFMAETRERVDELLSEGSIDSAETYMEERRVELVERGYSIRKINQAYFAFHGTYAESPSSTSPIARYLWDLREQVESVGSLVKLLRPVRTYEQFEELLVERGIELEG